MVLKKPEETSEIAWEIGSGMMPDCLRKVLDKRFITLQGADINGWSIMHLIVGGFFYLFNFGIIGANVFHALWEIFQAYFNITDLSKSSEWYDTLFDTLFFNLGYFLFAFMLGP